jgi:glutamine amidotransferase
MKVAIIKYNAGNICSVVNALRRVGVEPCVTDDPAAIRAADRVIFPGQGSAAPTMSYLRESGLDAVIASLTQPVLGICIGQQLMCRYSEEGDVDCLGIFDVDVKRFNASESDLKIPHMGWNTISLVKDDFIPCDLNGKYVYYVHSYYVPVNDATIATTDYILPYSAALHKGNFYATQFHPEKSGDIGEQILKSFLEL